MWGHKTSQEAVLHSAATAAAVRTNLSVLADLRAAVHAVLVLREWISRWKCYEAMGPELGGVWQR